MPILPERLRLIYHIGGLPCADSAGSAAGWIAAMVLAVVLGIVPSLVFYWMEPHVTGLIDSLVMIGR